MTALDERPLGAIRRYDGYLFDLDGTIYLGDTLLPGAHRLLSTLREMGCHLIFQDALKSCSDV